MFNQAFFNSGVMRKKQCFLKKKTWGVAAHVHIAFTLEKMSKLIFFLCKLKAQNLHVDGKAFLEKIQRF